MEAKFGSGEMAFEFVTAGAARVTLVSGKTGRRFTYRVWRRDESSPFFVSVLSGANNENDFTFIGTVFSDTMEFRHSAKSKVSKDATSFMAFSWAWKWLSRKALPPNCEVWHQGVCGHCGRSLTVPSSIETGLGPGCAKKLGRRAA